MNDSPDPTTKWGAAYRFAAGQHWSVVLLVVVLVAGPYMHMHLTKGIYDRCHAEMMSMQLGWQKSFADHDKAVQERFIDVIKAHQFERESHRKAIDQHAAAVAGFVKAVDTMAVFARELKGKKP